MGDQGHESKRTALILGVANHRSIAWAVARRLADSGFRLAITYQGERLRSKVEELAADLENPLVLPCDVTSDDEMDTLMSRVEESFGHLDSLVHSVAFAPREELMGAFSATTRSGFTLSHEISTYSLTALVHRATPLMEGRQASVVQSSQDDHVDGKDLALAAMEARAFGIHHGGRVVSQSQR